MTFLLSLIIVLLNMCTGVCTNQKYTTDVQRVVRKLMLPCPKFSLPSTAGVRRKKNWKRVTSSGINDNWIPTDVLFAWFIFLNIPLRTALFSKQIIKSTVGVKLLIDISTGNAPVVEIFPDSSRLDDHLVADRLCYIIIRG